MFTTASTLPPPTEPELEELELLLEEELLDELLELAADELLLELEVVVEELELDELELEELEEPPPMGPLQLPALVLPETLMLSMFARPALLVASRRMRLLPATRLTFTEPDPLQVVHAPVPSKAKVATALLLTKTLPERAVEPFA